MKTACSKGLFPLVFGMAFGLNTISCLEAVHGESPKVTGFLAFGEDTKGNVLSNLQPLSFELKNQRVRIFSMHLLCFFTGFLCFSMVFSDFLTRLYLIMFCLWPHHMFLKMHYFILGFLSKSRILYVLLGDKENVRCRRSCLPIS